MLSPLLEPTSSPLPKNYQLSGGNIANKYNIYIYIYIGEKLRINTNTIQYNERAVFV